MEIKYFLETILDPKCGCYYNEKTGEFICIAKVDGKYLVAGSFTEDCLIDGEEKKEIEKRIYSSFFGLDFPEHFRFPGDT